jgi:hypothetical protein
MFLCVSNYVVLAMLEIILNHLFNIINNQQNLITHHYYSSDKNVM